MIKFTLLLQILGQSMLNINSLTQERECGRFINIEFKLVVSNAIKIINYILLFLILCLNVKPTLFDSTNEYSDRK